MLFPIKDREDLEKLNELVSLQDQVTSLNYKINLVNKIFMKI